MDFGVSLVCVYSSKGPQQAPFLLNNCYSRKASKWTVRSSVSPPEGSIWQDGEWAGHDGNTVGTVEKHWSRVVTEGWSCLHVIGGAGTWVTLGSLILMSIVWLLLLQTLLYTWFKTVNTSFLSTFQNIAKIILIDDCWFSCICQINKGRMNPVNCASFLFIWVGLFTNSQKNGSLWKACNALIK